MSSKPILVYWDMRAVAEPIRLLLHYLEIDFEDKRFRFGDTGGSWKDAWDKEKFSCGLELPNLPYYRDGEFTLTQSAAILQYLGRKHNLYGDTIQEKATIDMVTQTTNDLRWSAWMVYNAPTFHDVKDEWRKIIPEKLSPMSNFLEGKEFVLGKKISIADIFLYESMQWYREFTPDIFENSPKLVALERFQKRIEGIPQIKRYLESDNYKNSTIFGPTVYFGHSKDPNFKPMPFSYRNFFSGYPLDPV